MPSFTVTKDYILPIPVLWGHTAQTQTCQRPLTKRVIETVKKSVSKL